MQCNEEVEGGERKKRTEPHAEQCLFSAVMLAPHLGHALCGDIFGWSVGRLMETVWCYVGPWPRRCGVNAS